MAKNIVPVFLLGISVLTFDVQWQSNWAITFFICSWLISAHFGNRFHWSVGLAIMSVLFSSLSIYGSPNAYASLAAIDPKLPVDMDAVTMRSTISLLMLAFAFDRMPKFIFKALDIGFAIVCLTDSVFVIGQKIYGIHDASGYIGNSSMNGCLIAMTYPFLVMQKEHISYHLVPLRDLQTRWKEIAIDACSILLPILAVFLSGQSVPVGVLVIAWVLYFWLNGGDIRGLEKKSMRIQMGIAIGFALMAIAALCVKDLFHSSGRFSIWPIVFDWFHKNGNNAFGYGPGTFYLWGPHIQSVYHVGENVLWGWAHNEYLQILFEQGFVGLFTVLIMLGFTIQKVRKSKDSHVLISLVCFLATAVFNFPLRVPITAVFGAYLLTRIWDDRPAT